MSLNRNTDPTNPADAPSELPIVASAVALLLLLLLAFYLVSCRGPDAPATSGGDHEQSAQTRGGQRIRTVTSVRTIPAPRPAIRYVGPWLTPRLRDRALAALPARVQGRAEAIPGIFMGGYGIKISRR